MSYLSKLNNIIKWTLLDSTFMKKSKQKNRVKAHYKGAKIVIILYYFWGVPCLNFNHVIIMKDFHNVFTYYGRYPKKSNAKETTLFYFIWCDVRIYLCQKHICHNVLKNANIFLKRLKWFLVFLKFVVSTKHCDSICLE